MATLWALNPGKRKKRGGKRRSKAQRAATKRMLAARFGHNPGKRKRRSGKRRARRRNSVSAVVAVRRRGGRRGGSSRGFSRSGAVAMLKAGAIAGAGAVLVDVGMGYASQMLATAAPSMASPLQSDGTPNYAYFGIKAGMALALGMYGGKVIPGHLAAKMGEGALTVLAYQFIRPMVPSGISLGFLNPAPTMRPSLGVTSQGSRNYIGRSYANPYIAGTGAYVSGTGAYRNVPVRSGGGSNRGSGAAQVLQMIGRR